MTTSRDLGSKHLDWYLTDCLHRDGDELASKLSPYTSPAGWWKATVPGLAAQDLISQGRIPDPYWGNQTMDARWVEERDFVYRTSFEVGSAEVAQPARLVFDMLDTFVSVFLNGERVATHENQYRRLFVDLTGKLKEGTNRLVLSFEAGWLGTVRRAGPKQFFWNEPHERLWVRKSQMSFGWDWAARTPTVGPAGPVTLEFSDGVWAGDLFARGEPNADGTGTLKASLPVKALEAGDFKLELEVDGKVESQAEFKLGAGEERTLDLETTLKNPRLWYPRELGEPALYQVRVRVRRGDKLVHEASARAGIRKIELVTRDPASPNGKVFYLRVNGKRIWAKGDNWLPLDFLHTRVTEDDYRKYFELLMAGGVNCIRVWGGGIVEHAPFYDLCDELGLLIWQDFGFACGVYPDTPEFLAEVRREADDVVKKLRTHPSIALYCGNNENEVLAVSNPKARFHSIYYEILPETIKALDPTRAYWPGSPASESRDLHPDSDQEGDRHNWDVWFGWKTTSHITDQARFNSEFGAQSFPQRESIETFMNPGDVWSVGLNSRKEATSPGFIFARHGAQMEKIFGHSTEYGPIWNLNSAIATSQYFQAEVLSRYIRHYRKNIAYTGGVIVWNYTSTWPSICWALVDWYRRPKQAFYEAKRCFRPTSVTISPKDASEKSYAAVATQDRNQTSEGRLLFELRAIDSGKVIASTSSDVRLDGFAVSAPLTLDIPIDLDRRTHALVASFEPKDKGPVEREIRYLETLARMRGFGGKVTAKRNGDSVEIRSTGWRTRVGLESYETHAIWDDNFLDLLPGETKTLKLALGKMPQYLWIVADMVGTRKALPPEGEVELAVLPP